VALRLAVVALLGVLAVAAWLGYRETQQAASRAALEQRLAESLAAQQTAATQAREHQAQLAALTERLTESEARLVELKNQQLGLQTRYEEIAVSRSGRLLAEAELLVGLAERQLQMTGNVIAALSALEHATAVLGQGGTAQFQSLRKRIARDSERLRAMPAPDLKSIAARLDGLFEEVANWPLGAEQRPPALPAQPAKPSQRGSAPATSAPATPSRVQNAVPPTPTFVRFLQDGLDELWQELRRLVRVERLEGAAPLPLAPEQAYFLREHLRLRLLAARSALLAHDNRAFQGDLRQADVWLTRHFDLRAPAVQAAQTTLRGWREIDIAPSAPGLDETRAALGEALRAQERAAAR